MGFRLEIWTRCLLAVGMVLAAVYSAGAQPASRRAGEAILFSSPDGDQVSSNVPSLTARPPTLLNPAPAAKAPIDFGAPPEIETMPMPPMVSPAQAQRMQRQLDEQKNWALMTPEQILGVPTPEKILGLQDRDMFGRPKRQTVEEQFYERQDQSRVRTNNYTAADSTSRGGPPDSQWLQGNTKLLNPAAGGPGNSTLMDQFLKGTADKAADSAPVPAGGWFRTFGSPAPPVKSAPEQQTAAEQYQQLFRSQPSSDDAVKVSAFEGPLYSTHPAKASSAGQFASPLGAAYAPLNNVIGLPAAAAPLPGLLAPTNRMLLTPAPEWKPQSAPWLSPAPQLGVAPQRKF